MLFNSHAFLFVFLPLVLLGFHVLHRWSRRVALGYVAFASLFFYGYWEPKYLALLVPSLIINYWLGEQLARTRRRAWLIFGLAANLAVIGWFKYSLFLYLTATGGATPPDFLKGIVLPLGISFITFQKIAYLVDIWRGHRKAASFDSFAFFVLFFPQLIAGPIVLYRNIDKQVRRHPRFPAYFVGAFQFGLMIFAIGLFKKVVLADSLSVFADDVFKWSERTEYEISPRDAWIGALAYSLQLYFDFSGYSDMAIGLGRMFGLRLPINFNSPYQATGIIDFWRRWHMTLTSFFRDYVYIPMGGNRRGLRRQLPFILIVFFLTGLWHGAGWTFVAWGFMHGLLVVGNHLWVRLCRPKIPAALSRLVPRLLAVVVSRGATMLAVVCLWVLFRATTWASAIKILSAMFFISPSTNNRAFADLHLYPYVWAILVLLWAWALFLPNSMTIARRARYGQGLLLHRPRPAGSMTVWRSLIPGMLTGVALYLSIASISNIQSKFIYFNF